MAKALVKSSASLHWFANNLVPRLFHLTAPAPEERPWFRLVTCLANKHNPLGGVPLSNKMSRRAFVTLKARLADKSTKMFFSSLHFAIVNSSYWNINLKPKQVKCLEAVYNGRDAVAVLPTGYGKSLIFHLLPSLLFDKLNCRQPPTSLRIRPVVIVVSPLNSLISDQIRRSTRGEVKSTVLSVRRNASSGDLQIDHSGDTDSSSLKEAKYDLVFMSSIWPILMLLSSVEFSKQQEMPL